MSVLKYWGNSLAVRIPKNYAEQLAWGPNTEVQATIVDGKLVIEAVPDRKYTLSQLLAAITPENLYGEIDSGAAMGNESW